MMVGTDNVSAVSIQDASKKPSGSSLNSIAQKVARNFKKLYKGVKRGNGGTFKLRSSLLRK